MYCRNCGKALPDQAKFCDQCGAQADSENGGAASGFANKPNQTGQGFHQSWKDTKWSSNIDTYVISALAYIPFLFWLPLAVDRGNSFGRKTANQGLILLIAQVVLQFIQHFLKLTVSFIASFLFPFSFLSGIIGIIIGVFEILLFIAMILGIVRGLKGEFYEVPVIGKINLI